MSRSPQDLLRGGVGIPTLPTIYLQLSAALDNPRSSTLQIAEIIGRDAATTARLLRLVNSAFYAFPSRIESVSQAVLLVGTKQIQDLLLATSVAFVFQEMPAGVVDLEAFWRHSFATGVAARLLAGHRREANTERFFVAGVLHDIGRLFMYKKLPHQAREVVKTASRTGAPVADVERAVFGFDHAGAAGVLLTAWNLPASLTEIVRCHHAPGEAREHPLETAVIHVADVLTTAMELGSSPEAAVPPFDPAAWECLDLPLGILGAVADQAEQQVTNVRRSLTLVA